MNEPVIDVVVRWDHDRLNAYYNEVGPSARYRPELREIRRRFRRWVFPNGIGVAVSYNAENPLPGCCPALGETPQVDHEHESMEFLICGEMSYEVTFARHIDELDLLKGTMVPIGAWRSGTCSRFKITDDLMLEQVLEEAAKVLVMS